MSQSEILPILIGEFARYKQIGEKVLEQLDDADFLYRPDNESNSLAVIIKHMAGNMRSRWTDFLTSDGEKPDRRRDSEFVEEDMTRERLFDVWDAGWQHVFDALEPLEESDLLRPVVIRGESYAAFHAIVRQLGHYAQHVGQMAYIGKHLKGDRWVSLSIPRGKSEEYLRGRP
jgi:hypothetical protein